MGPDHLSWTVRIGAFSTRDATPLHSLMQIFATSRILSNLEKLQKASSVDLLLVLMNHVGEDFILYEKFNLIEFQHFDLKRC